MRRLILAMTTTACLHVVPAAAQVRNFVEVCGNPDAAPRDVVRFCRKALDTGQLDARATAQVNANLGIGYFELGRYDDAVAAYTAALQTAPRMAAAYLNRARALERLGRLGEAADDYATVLELEPDAADAYVGRGVMLLSHGDPARAITDLTAAIRLEPRRTASYFNRGVAYLGTGAFAEAERDFSTVLQRDPRDAGALVNRGRARAALGRADAAEDFEQALAIRPEWSGAWYARGIYHDQRGDREAANRDFLRAYELGHSNPWLLQRVREISG